MTSKIEHNQSQQTKQAQSLQGETANNTISHDFQDGKVTVGSRTNPADNKIEQLKKGCGIRYYQDLDNIENDEYCGNNERYCIKCEAELKGRTEQKAEDTKEEIEFLTNLVEEDTIGEVDGKEPQEIKKILERIKQLKSKEQNENK